MAPQAMMGAGAQGIAKVHIGLKALNASLVGLPMGSDLHTAVMKAVIEIGKHLGKAQADEVEKKQAMLQQLKEMQEQPQAAMLQRMAAGGGQPQPPMMPGGGPPGA
jgi:hypothetical protein